MTWSRPSVCLTRCRRAGGDGPFQRRLLGGKSPACTFFSTVPFGLTAAEMNAWMYQGGGLALWRQLYGRFGLRPYPCGNTGMQMAGWFKRELRSLKDLRGLKMRISGLAAEVWSAVGGVPVSVPGAGLVKAMADDSIAACEWLGPYNDLAIGLQETARFCYYPGWQEPGSALELMVNKRAFEELPDDLQAIVESAAQAVNEDALAEYAMLNSQALVSLASEHQVEFRKLPDDVLAALKQASEQLVAKHAGSDPWRNRFTPRIWSSASSSGSGSASASRPSCRRADESGKHAAGRAGLIT